MTTATAPASAPAPAAPATAFDPRVFGESKYDRVTSMLMAVVVGAALVVGWLFLIYKTNQAYASRVTAPLRIIEVFGGGGGSPEGTAGSTEKIDVPGADAAAQASNNDEAAAELEEASVEATSAPMLDVAAEASDSVSEEDAEAFLPNGGPVRSGRRASKLGSGGPGLGLGPGDGGIPADQRWSIVYNPGQTVDEYARQLDSLGVELAVISGPDELTYVSRFSDPKPTTRRGSGQRDQRLYFLWGQGRGRKEQDVALLRKAGIEVGDGVMIQFYPKRVEEQLAQLEVRYRRRQPAEIRFTRFGVVPQNGGGYGLQVVAQEPLR